MIEASNPNLDLLLGVDLTVTADIGSAPLTVEQVLGLSSGSLVEFRQRVDQPIDLKVNGRVIARGEIVAVDGRFALRITELIAQQ